MHAQGEIDDKVLVLSYYHPWIAGGGHRPRRLIMEELARGREVCFIYADDGGTSISELNRLYEAESTKGLLHVGRSVSGERISFDRLSSRWKGFLNFSALLQQFLPSLVRIHNPSTSHRSLLTAAKSRSVLSIYDQMDLWSAFSSQPWGAANEDWFLENADLISGVSSYLAALQTSKEMAVIPNGVPDSFVKACREVRHNAVSDQTYDVIYAGAIWPDWIDWQVIYYLVEQLRGLRWCFVGALDGPVGEDHRTGARSRMRELQTLGYVDHFAEVPHEDLVELLCSSRVGIIPFKQIPLTLAASPIKAYDYLAAGLNVVSFATAELPSRPEIYQCGTHEGFKSAIKDALQLDQSSITDNDQFVDTITWSRRLDDFDRYIAGHPRDG